MRLRAAWVRGQRRGDPHAARAAVLGNDAVAGSARITVPARPEAFAFDPGTTAVLVVDMQNDFGAPGGMFARAGIDIGGIRAAVAPTTRVLAAARGAGIGVVYVKMGFRPDLSDMGPADAPNRIKHRPLGVGDAVTSPDGRASRTLVRDTWSTEVLEELAPQPGDAAVWKTRYSGFFETELDTLLRGRGVRSLIVTGCTTSVCVDSTIRDAMFRDYACLLLEDCTAEPIGSDLARTNHDASLLILQGLFAWVSTSDALVLALSSDRQ